jgi:hypothetical protein
MERCFKEIIGPSVFLGPYKGYAIRYHGGSAVVSKENFDFRQEEPEITKTPVGYNTPTGVYYYKRGNSSPVSLNCWRVAVFRNGCPETAKVRRRIEDRLRKDSLAVAIAAAWIK